MTNEQRLEAERRALREREAQLVASLGDSDQPGDRADQAQLLERLDELEWVRERITEITKLLTDLGELRGRVAADRIQVGTTADVEYQDGTRETVWVGPPALAQNGEAVVTPDSPLGQALLGHRVGDSVDYITPAGPQRVRVLAVRPPQPGGEAGTATPH